MSYEKIVLTEDEMQNLVNKYESILHRTAYMYLKDKYQTEDVFQEVLLRAFNKYQEFESENKEKAWLLKITKNACIDYKRIAWYKYVSMDVNIEELAEKGGVQSLVSNEVPETQLLVKEENEIIYNNVMKLPAKFKEIIVLYYYKDLCTSQISKIIGTSESNVRNRLCRARSKLKKQLIISLS